MVKPFIGKRKNLWHEGTMTLVWTNGQTNQAGESKPGRTNEGMHKKDAKFFWWGFLSDLDSNLRVKTHLIKDITINGLLGS